MCFVENSSKQKDGMENCCKTGNSCLCNKVNWNTWPLLPKTPSSGAVVPQCQSDIFTVKDQAFSNLLVVACYEIFYFRRKICDGILMYNLLQVIRTEIGGIKLKLGSDWHRLLWLAAPVKHSKTMLQIYPHDLNWQVPSGERFKNSGKPCDFTSACIQVGNVMEHRELIESHSSILYAIFRNS